jgi:deoxyribose-phosphate aldolase
MKLNQYIDHTLLKPEATGAQVDQVVREAVDNHFASVMINPYWVARVHAQLKGSDVKTATVIGFPLGANTTFIKLAEAKRAIEDGADELDMVLNIGELKAGNSAMVQGEIEQLVQLAHDHGRLLKVIIETALLTGEEIVTATRIVTHAHADFVKTSTGFSTDGATVPDVALMVQNVDEHTAVKASGGIHTTAEAEAMIAAGATRLGVSASMKIIGKA